MGWSKEKFGPGLLPSNKRDQKNLFFDKCSICVPNLLQGIVSLILRGQANIKGYHILKN